MWTITELKRSGKAAFKANYWRYVLVSVILMTLLGAGARTATNSGSNEELEAALGKLSPYELHVILTILASALLVGCLVSLLIKIFVTNPIMVGAYRFFIDGSNGEEVKLNTLLSAYKGGKFVKIFLTMFLKGLYITLWSLLLLIPGIIKAYSYRMVPYILAENPDMSPNEIITKSREMMNGYKMKAFVLDLSFIGWIILEIVTLGIAGIFYVNPYIFATDAELYKVLKQGRS